MGKRRVPEVPKSLVEDFRSRRAAIFVGAGLSKAAGLPGWSDLLTDILDRAKQRSFLPSKVVERDLRTLLKDSSKYLSVAQELEELMGAQFRDELVRALREAKAQPSTAHRILPDLPLSLIVTTNYDKLVEQAYFERGSWLPVYTYEDADDFVDALWSKERFILKAHGDLDRKKTMVITQKDYRKLVRTEFGYRYVVANVFMSHTVLFLGVSLRDPELALFLGYLQDAFRGSGHEHFALVPKTDFSEVDSRRWRMDFRVRTLRYDPSADHREVVEFLEALRDRVK